MGDSFEIGPLLCLPLGGGEGCKPSDGFFGIVEDGGRGPRVMEDVVEEAAVPVWCWQEDGRPRIVSDGEFPEHLGRAMEFDGGQLACGLMVLKNKTKTAILGSLRPGAADQAADASAIYWAFGLDPENVVGLHLGKLPSQCGYALHGFKSSRK
jgi:hypothetical protein